MKGQRFRLDRGAVFIVVGSAFLWLCLKSVPLALTREVRIGAEGYPGLAIGLYVAYAAVLLAVMLCIGRFRRDSVRAGSSRVFVCVAAGCGFAALATLTWASDEPVLFIAALMLSAVFVGTFLDAWGERIVALPAEMTPFVVTLSYALSELVRFALSWVEFDALRPLFPLVSLCLLLACPPPAHRSNATERASLSSISWGMIAASIALMILWSFVLGVFPQDPGSVLANVDRTWSYGLSCCIIAVMALFFRRCAVEGEFTKQMFLYPLTALVILYLFMLTGMQAMQSQEFILFKRVFVAIAQCLDVFVFALIVHSVSERRLSHVAVLGLYAAFCNAGFWMVVSDVVRATGLLAGSPGGEWAAFGLSFATAALFIVFLLRLAVARPRVGTDAGDEDGLKARCERAGVAAGLSKRELEVMGLLYRGYSAKRIAEVLYVSENTVRSHTSNIYKQMAVHSKQELMMLVDRYRD